MDSQEIIAMEQSHEMKVYSKRGIALEHGEAEFVYDFEGKKYIDCTTGVGVAVLGHAHGALGKAVSSQAASLMSCYQSFSNQPRAILEQKLCILFGAPSRVLLTNSGTESVETALKLARKHTGRKGFVAAMNSFHGRSSGALSVTFKEKYRQPFEPLLGPVKWARFNSIESLKENVTTDTAALILEVVQGEGGVRCATAEFLKAARDICTDKGALMIFDEVQTGCGRTGKFFAFEHFGITPDVAFLAKWLAGGVPIGATIASEQVASFGPLDHGSTFGGNPLACAAANAVISTIESQRLLEKVSQDGAYFMKKLQSGLESKQQFRELRGMGLMVAVELKVPSKQPLADMASAGVLALPAGEQVVRFLPPFIISRQSLDAAANALFGAIS